MTPEILQEAKRRESTLRVLCSGSSMWTYQNILDYLQRCIEEEKP